MVGEKYVRKQLRGQLKIRVNELDISVLLHVLFCSFSSCQLLFPHLFLLFFTLFFLFLNHLSCLGLVFWLPFVLENAGADKYLCSHREILAC